ncbi:MAG: diaminopimelate dehydrogenase, partial [Oscillospiraceae bacterium]|nr:diaminopimelate dehydrogenase [Oscillospiraceae bacterium]
MIRVGIVGYGNVAAGAVKALALASDIKLVAVFTRRDPKTVSLQEGNAPILHIDTAKEMINDIDVMLLCGGSATDLPEQAPYFAKMFNTVDSYDNHAKIPEYMAEIDKAASKTTAIVSVGWDP